MATVLSFPYHKVRPCLSLEISDYWIHLPGNLIKDKQASLSFLTPGLLGSSYLKAQEDIHNKMDTRPTKGP